jgi:hypothetical protein
MNSGAKSLSFGYVAEMGFTLMQETEDVQELGTCRTPFYISIAGEWKGRMLQVIHRGKARCLEGLCSYRISTANQTVLLDFVYA